MQSHDIVMWNEESTIAQIKEIYGSTLSMGEFNTFVAIGKATGLNPFLRELWAVKYGSSPAQIFIARDGYRKSAQANPEYDYHLVDAVFELDDFQVEQGQVKHIYGRPERGKLVGAYCIVKRKSASLPMFTYVELREYTTGKSLWATKPATMLKKVAEAQGLRMAFQALFAGTYHESENWRDAEISEYPIERLPVEPGLTVDDLLERCKQAKSISELRFIAPLAKLLSEEDKILLRQMYQQKLNTLNKETQNAYL